MLENRGQMSDMVDCLNLGLTSRLMRNFILGDTLLSQFLGWYVEWSDVVHVRTDETYFCRVCVSRCSCDECNIVRLVASGIVSPELTDQLSHSGAGALAAPSYHFADVLPEMIMTGAGDGHLHNQLPMMFGPVTE